MYFTVQAAISCHKVVLLEKKKISVSVYFAVRFPNVYQGCDTGLELVGSSVHKGYNTKKHNCIELNICFVLKMQSLH